MAGRCRRRSGTGCWLLVATIGGPDETRPRCFGTAAQRRRRPVSGRTVLAAVEARPPRQGRPAPQNASTSPDRAAQRDAACVATSARLSGCGSSTKPAASGCNGRADRRDAGGPRALPHSTGSVSSAAPEDDKRPDEARREGQPGTYAAGGRGPRAPSNSTGRRRDRGRDSSPTAEADGRPRSTCSPRSSTARAGRPRWRRRSPARSSPPTSAKIGVCRPSGPSAQTADDLAAALTKAGGLGAPRKEPTADEVKALASPTCPKTGDAARGEAVFRRKEMQCLACHAVGGAGGQVGPDLTSIGASAQPDYLVDSLLLPNKAIKEGFHADPRRDHRRQGAHGIKVREAQTGCWCSATPRTRR